MFIPSPHGEDLILVTQLKTLLFPAVRVIRSIGQACQLLQISCIMTNKEITPLILLKIAPSHLLKVVLSV